jgi:hypothetical protein
MRTLVITTLAAGMLLGTTAARAQTYDPNYPVCRQVFGRFGHFDCSYRSLAQCKLNASAQAAQCVVNPYYAGAAGAPLNHHRRRHVH